MLKNRGYLTREHLVVNNRGFKIQVAILKKKLAVRDSRIAGLVKAFGMLESGRIKELEDTISRLVSEKVRKK